MHIELIYQDNSLVAINKLAGLLMHRSPIDRRETRFAMQLLRRHMKHISHPILGDAN